MSPQFLSFQQQGYSIIPNVFSPASVKNIISTIEATSATLPSFRKSNSLYAIRRVLQQIPLLNQLIFTPELISILTDHFGTPYPIVKSIYFDKPAGSNWFVAWHQDLTISVDKRTDTPGFGPWTIKPEQFSVQPPAHILENTYTIRIHLDNTDESNGALRVLPGSHTHGIRRFENLPNHPEKTQPETSCPVPAGGIMLMRPLLFHSSSRSKDDRRRRVIHIECCSLDLPSPLTWAEKTRHNSVSL